jgi:hypothetical protein
MMLAWSDNEGKNWSPPVKIGSDSGFFSQVKVGKAGKVFYTYSIYRSDGGIASHYLLTSSNYGTTFITHKIADFYNYPYSPDEKLVTLKGTRGIRAFPYSVMEYDPTQNMLHVIYGSYKKWSDGTRSAELYYSRTSDDGLSWTVPIEIQNTEDPHSDRFMPWIGIDKNSDDVHLVYYSSQADSNNILTAPYREIIKDVGSTIFMRLSDSLFNPLSVTDNTSIPFIGDYIGCAIDGMTSVYSWTENRKGYSDGDIFVYISHTNSGVPEVHQVSARSLSIYSAYPNPASNKLTLGIAIPQTGNISIFLCSIDGILIKKLFEGEAAIGISLKEFDITGIRNGDYFISLKTDYGSAQKKIIVMH